MKQIFCPNCGSQLIEDASEEITETKLGAFILDAYPAFVCDKKCGYERRLDPAKVIGQLQANRLLLLYPNDSVRLLDTNQNILWPAIHTQNISMRFVEKHPQNQDIKAKIKQANDINTINPKLPNLFHYASSELSQDAFLCWLLSWAHNSYRSSFLPLHETSNLFLTKIFQLHGKEMPELKTIEIKTQFEFIDILVIINEKYAILIEDKTHTKNHSNQLSRYRKTVAKEYPNLIQLPIYYKTMDQSDYQSIIDAGYQIFTRKIMINILKNGIYKGITNTIFVDYFLHLKNIENKINAFQYQPIDNWDGYAWQGFYQALQKEINGNWGYVPNPSGGFWGFWWKSNKNNDYYIQLEQTRLCLKIKVNKNDDKKSLRNSAMNKILTESKHQELHLQRPTRLGVGETMTIANRYDYIQTNDNGFADVNKTIEQLQKY